MVQLCHLNDCGSLWLFSPVAIRVHALLFAFQLVQYMKYTIASSTTRVFSFFHTTYERTHSCSIRLSGTVYMQTEPAVEP
jgi:hypothetical protein